MRVTLTEVIHSNIEIKDLFEQLKNDVIVIDGKSYGVQEVVINKQTGANLKVISK